MGRSVAFLSFRFGATDGVSGVARSWMHAFEELGARVVTVTGSDTEATPYPGLVVPGLGLDDEIAAGDIEPSLRSALDDFDLVVVENLLTIPINLEASAAAAAVLAGRPALLHHHDPPWHRERYAHITSLPGTDPAWRHVAITHRLAAELAERGISARTIHNAFDRPAVRTESERRAIRDRVRAAVGFATDERVVAHPVRAIERKNIPGAIALAEALDATYWLLGPAEEGYDHTLTQHLDSARCRVVHQGWGDKEGFYLAADHIAFPSTWEGFGNPPIEASLHRRTVSVGNYPVATELRSHGFRWFRPEQVGAIREAMDHPGSAALRERLDHDEELALRDFSVETMSARLVELLDEAGWTP